MTVLRVIFSNKDPLLVFHQLKGGGEGIPYPTVIEYLEYLDVYEAIKEQQEKEMNAEVAKARQGK